MWNKICRPTDEVFKGLGFFTLPDNLLLKQCSIFLCFLPHCLHHLPNSDRELLFLSIGIRLETERGLVKKSLPDTKTEMHPFLSIPGEEGDFESINFKMI